MTEEPHRYVFAWKRLARPESLNEPHVFVYAFRHIEWLARRRTGLNSVVPVSILDQVRRDLVGSLGHNERNVPTSTDAGQTVQVGPASPVRIGSLALSAFARGFGRPLGTPKQALVPAVLTSRPTDPRFGQDTLEAREILATYFSVELMLSFAYSLRGIAYVPELDIGTVLMAEFIMTRVERGCDVRQAFSRALSVVEMPDV